MLSPNGPSNVSSAVCFVGSFFVTSPESLDNPFNNGSVPLNSSFTVFLSVFTVWGTLVFLTSDLTMSDLPSSSLKRLSGDVGEGFTGCFGLAFCLENKLSSAGDGSGSVRSCVLLASGLETALVVGGGVGVSGDGTPWRARREGGRRFVCILARDCYYKKTQLWDANSLQL